MGLHYLITNRHHIKDYKKFNNIKYFLYNVYSIIIAR